MSTEPSCKNQQCLGYSGEVIARTIAMSFRILDLQGTCSLSGEACNFYVQVTKNLHVVNKDFTPEI
jgi:hypothetical protein